MTRGEKAELLRWLSRTRSEVAGSLQACGSLRKLLPVKVSGVVRWRLRNK